MGLRFRKSFSLFPGVKLNFGTTGMSVSTGVPGLEKHSIQAAALQQASVFPELGYTMLTLRT